MATTTVDPQALSLLNLARHGTPGEADLDTPAVCLGGRAACDALFLSCKFQKLVSFPGSVTTGHENFDWDMADKKETLGNAEHDSNPSSPIDGPTKKPPFKQRYIAHHKRWWWLYLIIFIIVVLVVVLPVIYVGYPHIAQNSIDDSTLTPVNLSLSEPTPDQVTVHIGSTVGTHSKYHPTIYSFEGHFYLEGGPSYPFVNATTPQQNSVHNGDYQQVNQRINVTQAFTDYLIAVLLQEEIGVRLKGNTKLKEGGLPKANINYNKCDLTIFFSLGFNGFKGTTTENVTLLTTAQPDGANIVAQVTLPNPTVTTFDYGNCTFTLTTAIYPPLVPSPSYVNLGTAWIEHLRLVPYNRTNTPNLPDPNTFSLRSNTNQSLVLELIGANQTLKETGMLPVYVQGSKSVVNGVEIPYFTESLSKSVVLQELDVGSALRKAGLGSVLGGNSTSEGSKRDEVAKRSSRDDDVLLPPVW
ncbi:MAG: hypothetical protein Q9227_009483 [Pyrenula ochraceoflavens]